VLALLSAMTALIAFVTRARIRRLRDEAVRLEQRFNSILAATPRQSCSRTRRRSAAYPSDWLKRSGEAPRAKSP